MATFAHIWLLLATATLTAVLGVFAGAFYSSSRKRVSSAIPLSAGLLIGVALFGLLPELAEDLSWTVSLLIFAVGFLVLTALDRLGVAICPDCTQDHDHHGRHEHDGCAAPLHGFAIPLLIAAGMHALFDGWALAASSQTTSPGVRVALPLALILHKLPEGLALGGILKSALRSRWAAIGLGTSVELLTLCGGGVSLLLAQRLSASWTSFPLALAGGFFLFLAVHALHGEWKRRRRNAVINGLAGVAVAAILQAGLRSYFGF